MISKRNCLQNEVEFPFKMNPNCLLRKCRRTKMLFSVGICLFLITLLLGNKFYSSSSSLLMGARHLPRRPISNQTCVLPDLSDGGSTSPIETSFRNILHPLRSIFCSRQEDWVEVASGTVRVRPAKLLLRPDIRCNFSFVERLSDHHNRISEVVSVSGSREVPLKSDFFHVACWLPAAKDRPGNGSSETGANGTAAPKDVRPVEIWRNVMAGVKRKDNLSTSGLSKTESGKSDASKMPNVLMWGFDSLSRVGFTNKLPKTYRFLTETLGGVVLKGYNIVGDGTPQALIPILTGKAEPELPETRKRIWAASNFVNVYPFVWNDYSAAGYVTAFFEDCPQTGTFNYRLKGFDDQPTDHYTRPFFLEVDKVKSEHHRYCLGAVPRHKVLMNYMEEFFSTYQNVPKFAFAFHGELSHDDPELIEIADDDLESMLKSLYRKGHLNNTVLMVMSDHGPRFFSTRETQRGKQEERLPFFAISLPEHSRTSKSVEYRHLLLNSNRLTTPFDIYPTLLHVLNGSAPSGEKRAPSSLGKLNRAISLLTEVPLSRSCVDAGIEAHWCACLEFDDVGLDHAHVIQATQSLIDYLNSLTQSHREKCQALHLERILTAQRYVPQADLLHFKSSADTDGFVGDFSANTNISDVIYQVQIATRPGGGHFEASILYNQRMRNFVVTEHISRTNAYGKSAHCVASTSPDLRKYCVCYDK